MPGFRSKAQSGLWMGLIAVIAVGVTTLRVGHGGVRADDDAPDQAKTKAEIEDAKKEVERLESHFRAAETSLAKARARLASLSAAARVAVPELLDAFGNPPDKKLEGVWRIVGINGHNQGEFQKPPYDEYKIMSGGHYLWLSFRPGTGEVLRSGGGVYTLKDGAYTARIECSNSPDLLSIMGKEYSGRCMIDGDKYYHNGHVPNGASFDEVWQRVH